MAYNKGQGSFGFLRGNLKAMVRQLVEGQGPMNANDQVGAGGAQNIKATYDFSIDGGGIGTIQIFNSIVIPAGMIIYGGLLDVPVSLNGGGGATVAIGFGTGAQSAALKAATGFATYSAGSIIALIPVWTAASAVQVAVDSKLSVTIAVAALTAGKISIELYGHMAGV